MQTQSTTTSRAYPFNGTVGVNKVTYLQSLAPVTYMMANGDGSWSVFQADHCTRCNTLVFTELEASFDERPTPHMLKQKGFSGMIDIVEGLFLPELNDNGTCFGCEHIDENLTRDEVLAQMAMENAVIEHEDDLYN